MNAVEAVARLLLGDILQVGRDLDEPPSGEELDRLWAALPDTDLHGDLQGYGRDYYLGRAREYLGVAVAVALDEDIAWQRRTYSDGSDRAALGRLVGMEDAARALRGATR